MAEIDKVQTEDENPCGDAFYNSSMQCLLRFHQLLYPTTEELHRCHSCRLQYSQLSSCRQETMKMKERRQDFQ